jgi:hypothetical protein
MTASQEAQSALYYIGQALAPILLAASPWIKRFFDDVHEIAASLGALAGELKEKAK